MASDAVMLVGSLPPPYNGQSIAFQTLVDGVGAHALSIRTIDITGGEVDRDGRATWRRGFEYLVILLRFVAALPRVDVVYLQIAQSRHGFVRDAVMITLASWTGRRVVAHLHGGNYDLFVREQPAWLVRVIRRTLGRVDDLLVLGEALLGMFDFAPELRDRLSVVVNGLPEEAPEWHGPRTLPEAGQPIRLLFMSNLFESKGFLELLRAVDILVHREGIPIDCRFCGRFRSYVPDDVEVKSAEHAAQLFDETVAELGLEDSASYLGVVTGDEKERLLRDSHLFILPTRYGKEGQPISIIEAIAYGLVVVSTRYRAIPDLVRDGETGALLGSGDAEEIAAAVARLARDPDGFRRASEAARRHFDAHFTRATHVAAVAEFLKPSRPGAGPVRA